ncbi:flagellar hook-associated family protein [Amorphus sp. 3PC139-8]|uniref:flagellar hook-associated family protein n=1 Tax=Amorphus sp. 3PC139-8 TaxID=2735676 RepID=UPI00345DAD90
MRTSLISTMSLNSAPRTGLAEMQERLAAATKEVATGRHADTGLVLADRTGRTVSLRQEMGSLDSMITSNSVARSRIEKTHLALEDIGGSIQSLQNNLTGLPDSTQEIAILRRQANDALDKFVSTMNTADGRVHLFAGTNSETPPLAEYDSGPKAALDAALIAKFGLTSPPQEDTAGLAAITPADMSDFLDNEFAAMFSDPDWTSVWSSAADEPLQSRISPTETVATSISANGTATRDLAKALTALADFGIDHLAPETRAVVFHRSLSTMNAGLTQTVTDRAMLGVSQQRLDAADTRMRNARDIVEQRIAAFEAVNPVEKKAEIDQLSVQIEMSYSLTAKLLRLSIMNYA